MAETPGRLIRIDDQLWSRAQEIAQARGENLSEIVRKSLRRYVGRHQAEVEQAAAAKAEQ